VARKKSVISLISYDAYMLPNSIKTYYPYVDEIVLGLDKDRISWSGNPFSFDEAALWKELKSLDYAGKISIVEENFHRSSIPIENDNAERNYLKQQCTHDWVFSFDADEYLINAKEFFKDFCPLVENMGRDLMFYWYLPYKSFDEGTLFIADESGRNFLDKEVQGFATDRDRTYTFCRWTDNPKRLQSPLCILHYSFCRPDEDLTLKINNFGHSIESKQDPFYQIQKQITMDNYFQLTNFKTSNMGPQWPRLMFVPKDEISSKCVEQAKRVYQI
jgi:hypothetical protein